ncbi:MAG: hypothetical protein J5669_03315 [Bacteroidales bacterium]|nr:hypothetical protein [Bacteroidales bacterium]
MKVDFFKAVIAVALCALLGYLCYLIAPETENQHIMAWVVCSVSTLLALVPAMALSYPESGNRSLSGKVFLWAAFAVILLTNLGFCFFRHDLGPLILVVGLEVLIAAYVAYSILKK